MDKDFSKAKSEFVTQRINAHSSNEPENVNSAYMELRSLVDRLRTTLSEEQKLILRDLENAYHVADGETERYYYKAGFNDAIHFLLHFDEEDV